MLFPPFKLAAAVSILKLDLAPAPLAPHRQTWLTCKTSPECFQTGCQGSNSYFGSFSSFWLHKQLSKKVTMLLICSSWFWLNKQVPPATIVIIRWQLETQWNVTVHFFAVLFSATSLSSLFAEPATWPTRELFPVKWPPFDPCPTLCQHIRLSALTSKCSALVSLFVFWEYLRHLQQRAGWSKKESLLASHTRLSSSNKFKGSE